jgi:hypothetical protein
MLQGTQKHALVDYFGVSGSKMLKIGLEMASE